jgi:hypothetical protein
LCEVTGGNCIKGEEIADPLCPLYGETMQGVRNIKKESIINLKKNPRFYPAGRFSP